MNCVICHTPGIDGCIQLMNEYRMLNNIRHHSLVVAQVADALFCGLEDGTQSTPLLDRKLIITGALLHDIAKTPCLEETCDHAALGGQICEEHGYPEIGAIVREHVILQDHDPDRYRSGLFNEKEIVYYADKRVRHDEIVSLEERLIYILDHYARDDQRLQKLIRENFERCLILEEALFTILPFRSDELEARVRFPQPPPGKEFDPWD
jgi:putative nucleotidyltransferase with HDIG domain